VCSSGTPTLIFSNTFMALLLTEYPLSLE